MYFNLRTILDFKDNKLCILPVYDGLNITKLILIGFWELSHNLVSLK